MVERYYIAAPFEAIPEEVYSTHTKIQKNDLYLSQIKKDYGRRVNTFALNAVEEKKYLVERENQLKQRIQFINDRLEEQKEIAEKIAKMKISKELNEAIEAHLKQKEVRVNKEKAAATNELSKIPQKVETSEKRYAVLSVMDAL